MDLLLSSTLVLGTPLLFAALGGLIAERSGVINLGLEGLLLVGAFSAALAAAATQSVLVGVLVSVLVGGLGGALLGFLVVVLRADQIVTGIAFNIAALGITGFLFGIIGPSVFRTPAEVNTRVPLLADLPVIGVLFDAHWIAFVGYALVGLVFVVLFRTGLGIRVRASGESAEAARASGVNVLRTRMVAMTVSGSVVALGGAYMALADTHQFGDNMINGRGYIAFAIIILGRWKPVGVLAAAGLFAFAQGLDLFAQARSLPIPLELVQAVPYLIALTTAALLGRKATPPAEEGRPLMLAN